MSRNRAKGTAQETKVVSYLNANVSDFIVRQPLSGSRDKGDVANLRTHNNLPIVVEVKHTARTELGVWAAEAEAERVNAGAIAGVISHKRVGKGAAGDQWVTCTLRDFVAAITGSRPADG